MFLDPRSVPTQQNPLKMADAIHYLMTLKSENASWKYPTLHDNPDTVGYLEAMLKKETQILRDELGLNVPRLRKPSDWWLKNGNWVHLIVLLVGCIIYLLFPSVFRTG
jgi:hypothetical protein